MSAPSSPDSWPSVCSPPPSSPSDVESSTQSPATDPLDASRAPERAAVPEHEPRKRTADGPPPGSPPVAKFPALRAMRAEDEEDARKGKVRKTAAEYEAEMWYWARDACNDIIEGRGQKHFEEWEGGFEEMCDLIDEHDALEQKVKRQDKEIKRLKARCEKLERRLSIKNESSTV